MPFEQIYLFAFFNVPNVNDAAVGPCVNIFLISVVCNCGDFALDWVGIGRIVAEWFLLIIEDVLADAVLRITGEAFVFGKFGNADWVDAGPVQLNLTDFVIFSSHTFELLWSDFEWLLGH